MVEFIQKLFDFETNILFSYFFVVEISPKSWHIWKILGIYRAWHDIHIIIIRWALFCFQIVLNRYNMYNYTQYYSIIYRNYIDIHNEEEMLCAKNFFHKLAKLMSICLFIYKCLLRYRNFPSLFAYILICRCIQ